MAKTNFTKVEDALNEGIMRMTISGLLDMASIASQIGSAQSSVPLSGSAARKQLVATLLFEIKHCKDEKLFEAGGMPKVELKDLLQNHENLKPEDWAKLKTFREKADAYKKRVAASLPEDANEKLIESQRKRHINKRYNTKEQWLPLH